MTSDADLIRMCHCHCHCHTSVGTSRRSWEQDHLEVWQGARNTVPENSYRTIPCSVVIPEVSARGESQSNGAVEQAAQVVAECVRALKEQVEQKATFKRGPTDTISLWMFRLAAMLCSKYTVGSDGQTAHERRRGRRCRIPVVASCERVLYKQIREGRTEETHSRVSTVQVCGWVIAETRMSVSLEQQRVSSGPTLSAEGTRHPGGMPGRSRV